VNQLCLHRGDATADHALGLSEVRFAAQVLHHRAERVAHDARPDFNKN
jgi:hypothetical protein